jgi:hypothetical protein
MLTEPLWKDCRVIVNAGASPGQHCHQNFTESGEFGFEAEITRIREDLELDSSNVFTSGSCYRVKKTSIFQMRNWRSSSTKRYSAWGDCQAHGAPRGGSHDVIKLERNIIRRN